MLSLGALGTRAGTLYQIGTDRKFTLPFPITLAPARPGLPFFVNFCVGSSFLGLRDSGATWAISLSQKLERSEERYVPCLCAFSAPHLGRSGQSGQGLGKETQR